MSRCARAPAALPAPHKRGSDAGESILPGGRVAAPAGAARPLLTSSLDSRFSALIPLGVSWNQRRPQAPLEGNGMSGMADVGWLLIFPVGLIAAFNTWVLWNLSREIHAGKRRLVRAFRPQNVPTISKMHRVRPHF
jgi:hypothetical protein